MRILLVSAHYPPDLVSGGTLVPQRLARGFRDRGHDVAVYAGSMRADRSPGSTWDEPGEDGIPVRWVAIRPFTTWSDPRNSDNPVVTEDFAAHLEVLRPDVVHFHSLQALGAPLVRAAADRGIPTVVTMHDFWWVCGRQFLVDPQLRPCELVVDCGTCRCDVDMPWRVARGAALREELRSADLILAPSRTMASALAANGIPPDRLAVDENGVPDADASPKAPPVPEHEAHDDLVLRYAGGADLLKGLGVVVDAAERITAPSGWRILVHADGRQVEQLARRIGRVPIDVLPPFGHDRIDEVMAATDVLLVPSIARESHSLITREALLRGVPVVCSDTLGPEEVVVHGVNGLVVPAGDGAALAASIDQLVADRGLVDRLRKDIGDIQIRSVAEQVDGLLERYETVRAVHRHRHEPPVRRVAFVVGIDGAPLRYRAQLPAEALATAGVASTVRHYRDPDLAEAVAGADVVVFYRVPATVQVLALIEATRAAGTVTLFDVDDLIFDPDVASGLPTVNALPAADRDLYLQGVRRYRTTMEACDGYIGSTPMLVEHAAEATGLPTYLFENGVGMELARRAEVARRRPRRKGPLRIGYLSGTTTHDEDWRHVEGAVLAVLDRHPDTELWLGGHLTPSDRLARLGDRVRRLPFRAWWELPEVLRDLDVNLAPLEPGSRFNDAKSAIKWLEAALTETPTVASPTRPFADAIEDGVTGFLANAPGEWEAALDQLLVDAELRHRVGRQAHRQALLRWSPHLQADRYLKILADATRAARPARGASTWEPVALDEPPHPYRVGLMPYPSGGPGLDDGTSQGGMARRWLLKLRQVVRDVGVLGTIRRLGPAIGRRLLSRARQVVNAVRARLPRRRGTSELR